MTQRDHREDATSRAAGLIAQALSELQQTSQSSVSDVRHELAANRAILQDLAGRVDQHLTEQRQQNVVLGGQLSALAGSLDRLVDHLQGLSTLMSGLLDRIAEPAAPAAVAQPEPEPAVAEPAFQPGGEGLSLVITGILGFQMLMDIQKGLSTISQVAHASVERFQEGDSRLLVSLTAPITASEITQALIQATSQTIAIEEARPELTRLHLKIIPTN